MPSLAKQMIGFCHRSECKLVMGALGHEESPRMHGLFGAHAYEAAQSEHCNS